MSIIEKISPDFVLIVVIGVVFFIVYNPILKELEEIKELESGINILNSDISYDEKNKLMNSIITKSNG